MEKWVQRQLGERQQPVGQQPVMFQRWVHLLFLHWMVDSETIQRTLPPGLFVDTYQGKAWIGIVPFCMKGIRSTLMPFLSIDFLELNLRTYVRDHQGRPGVWFYSLDADQPLAVLAARLFYALPYRNAKMQMADRDAEIKYSCRRRGSASRMEYRYRPSANLGEAKLGSLDFFLIERYRLFAFRRGRLLTGRVYHSPYTLREAIVSNLDKSIFELDGLPSPSGAPNSVLYSPRVDVTVYAIEAVD